MINFDYITHKRHVLFSGTQILQGRPEGDNVYLKAVVIRTGDFLIDSCYYLFFSGNSFLSWWLISFIQ